jgi:hypothetical protein
MAQMKKPPLPVKVTKKVANEVTAKATVAKEKTKKTMTKELTGPAAVKALQNQVSKAGVKKAEANAKKAIDKKYPGLYKKSK